MLNNRAKYYSTRSSWLDRIPGRLRKDAKCALYSSLCMVSLCELAAIVCWILELSRFHLAMHPKGEPFVSGTGLESWQYILGLAS